MVELAACTTVHYERIYINNDQAEEKRETFGIALGSTPDLDSRITLINVLMELLRLEMMMVTESVDHSIPVGIT